jgi:hypothetical protein
MKLPIHQILWAGNNSQHHDHLHVEGSPRKSGTPPRSNPGMTPAVEAIWNAMTERYGTGYYFSQSPPPEPNWAHMGIYNRRQIAGSTQWSQHAYANAIDIGPLYGSAQKPVYDYLTNYEETGMATYRGVRNVPQESNGAPKAWAKAVIDWGISSGVIITGDATVDDWENKAYTDGRLWTMLYRLRR